MLGGVINAVFLGPEQALTILHRLVVELPAGLGTHSPDSDYYLGALGFPCCAGLFDMALMAGLGALGGLLWHHLSTPRTAASPTVSGPRP